MCLDAAQYVGVQSDWFMCVSLPWFTHFGWVAGTSSGSSEEILRKLASDFATSRQEFQELALNVERLAYIEVNRCVHTHTCILFVYV